MAHTNDMTIRRIATKVFEHLGIHFSNRNVLFPQPLEEVLEVLKEGIADALKQDMLIPWDFMDVRMVDVDGSNPDLSDLTDEECREVLDHCYRKHDQHLGVTLETVRIAIDDMRRTGDYHEEHFDEL